MSELMAMVEDSIALAERETGHKLSIMQKAYIISLTELKGDELAAAKMAGYTNAAASVVSLRQNPTVALAIRGDVIAQFQSLAVAAISHYRKVLHDPFASDTSKNAAAEAVLNRAGILQAKPGAGKDKDHRELDDLSPAELGAMINGLEAKRDKIKDKKDAIDVTPSPE